ncbi:DUF4020 domain-containing protein [Promicromonospora sukumoe]|uniref:SIR2-like protein n=1 Tax=Promicromonospora sukumoe TaxID=88382 RepID=A0A7W3J9J6_9MICO|nr:SIR2 family protein [Promicromonospora sukumoe]MBA8808788.1 hypothetical protein [Promicromonospora sukumoe]
MWITGDVDLPAEILDAHVEHRLVFFVGAGASVDPPSSLPLFGSLARQLADAARVEFDEKQAIDAFLGSMPASFETHVHASRLIAREGSTYNATHSAIIRLASAIGPVRVVTTNFDDHLTSAAIAESVRIDDKWVGPALPLGDTFNGIVHLHGSILRPPQELVLIDRDFGRAYLTDAWATRFLQKMFDSFTVLFVGYSHDDPIMRYLSLGLPSNTRRYVLTHQPDNQQKWGPLGIWPIGYPAPNNDHSALVLALQAWDSRARMGRLEHRASMQEIIAAGPSLTPVDRDYLTSRVQTVDGARDFTDLANGPEWLQWAESLPEFQALFTGKAESDAARVLGNWFGKAYVANPALHGAALQTVQRLGQRFSEGLFQSATWAAEQLSKTDSAAGQRWKTFLATSVYGRSAPANLEMLLPYMPGDSAEHPAVIHAALQPILALKRRWAVSEDDGTKPPDAEVKWQIDTDSLTAHALKLVNTSDPGDLSIGLLLEDSLNNAYSLLVGYHGDDFFDGFDFGRSAIEPHPQDDLRNPVDALIDALREYGQRSLPNRPDLPERWWALDHAIFRRLALHLIDLEPARSADDKLRWILDRDLLYEATVKHEAYRVLATVVPEASPVSREALLTAALAGPDFPDGTPDRDKHASYSTYNLLVWMSRSAPDWSEVGTALQEAQANNPAFAPREHPDMDMWVSSGVWGGTLTIEPEELVQLIDTDPGEAMDELLSHDYSERNFGKPSWDDALSVVRRAAEIRPDAGARLWRRIGQQDKLGTKANDLRHAIIGGWEVADLGVTAEAVIALIRARTSEAESARPISRFLLAQIRKQVEGAESPTIAAMRDVARDLWLAHHSAFAHRGESDPTFLALNSWPGELTSYWLTEIDRRWRRDRDGWTGLNDSERGALLELLSGPEPTLDATRPALAGEVYFLFVADAAFTEANVLPLFQEEATAAQAWGAYLYNPRCNDRMLKVGFLDSVVAEWDRLDAFENRGHKDQFFGLVAWILTFAGISKSDRQELLDRSVLAADGAYAPEFAATVVRLLHADGVDGAQVWELWLRDHLAARLAGIPRTARKEELARWADAVPYLAGHIPDAISLLGSHRIGLGDQYRPPDFPVGALESHGPDLVNHLADRIRNSSPTGWLIPHAVRRLLEAVRAKLGDAASLPLMDAAAQSGFPAGGPG